MQTKNSNVPYTEPENYSIDDIPKYVQCTYRGDRGRVMDVGGDVLPKVKGRHIEIRLDESGERHRVHENLVHKYLNDRRILWIDFESALCPYTNK